MSRDGKIGFLQIDGSQLVWLHGLLLPKHNLASPVFFLYKILTKKRHKYHSLPRREKQVLG